MNAYGTIVFRVIEIPNR